MVVRSPQLATVSLDNRSADPQPHPSTVLLSRKESVEDLSSLISRKSHAGVLNRDQQLFVAIRFGSQCELARAIHRLHCVEQSVAEIVRGARPVKLWEVVKSRVPVCWPFSPGRQENCCICAAKFRYLPDPPEGETGKRSRRNFSRCCLSRKASVPPARVADSAPATLANFRQSSSLAPRTNW